MFKMTLREALKIQGEQVAYYGRLYPGGMIALAAKMTECTVSEEHAIKLGIDTPRDTVEVDRLVPRGWDIERLCGCYQGKVDA